MFSLYKKVAGDLGSVPERERERDPILGWRVPKLRNRGEGRRKEKRRRERKKREEGDWRERRNRRRERRTLEEWNGEEAAYGRTWTMT